MRDVWSMLLCQGKERLKGDNGKVLHPTQKPEELLKRIILGFSNENDVVLDPFAGVKQHPMLLKNIIENL